MHGYLVIGNLSGYAQLTAGYIWLLAWLTGYYGYIWLLAWLTGYCCYRYGHLHGYRQLFIRL